jgi:hypothetical protein
MREPKSLVLPLHHRVVVLRFYTEGAGFRKPGPGNPEEPNVINTNAIHTVGAVKVAFLNGCNIFTGSGEAPFPASNGAIISDGIEADFLEFTSGTIARISVSPQCARLIVS